MYDTFLIFRVVGHLCAVPAGEVQEIVHIAATTHLPGQPSVLHGFLNLRGVALPVVALRGLFSLPPAEPGLYAALIVLKASGSGFALLADTVEEVITVDRATLQPLAPRHSFNDCAAAQFPFGQGPVIVLSSDRLLLAKERACIAMLQAEVQQRLQEAAEQSA